MIAKSMKLRVVYFLVEEDCKYAIIWYLFKQKRVRQLLYLEEYYYFVPGKRNFKKVI